jgi:hypothetical protein
MEFQELIGKKRLVCAAACASLLGAAAPASAAIVDVTGLNGVGTVVALAAGTYKVNFIDVAQGGAYGDYSPWSSTSGCDGSGMNCSTGFEESIAIDFGHGTNTFDHQDGFQYGSMAINGDNRIYATGVQALAAIQTVPLFFAPLPVATNPNAYTSTGNPITFTLATSQSVNFFVLDNPYGDNRGGVSLSVTTPTAAVPEPATWALMLLGFGGLGAVLRRRHGQVTLAA